MYIQHYIFTNYDSLYIFNHQFSKTHTQAYLMFFTHPSTSIKHMNIKLVSPVTTLYGLKDYRYQFSLAGWKLIIKQHIISEYIIKSETNLTFVMTKTVKAATDSSCCYLWVCTVRVQFQLCLYRKGKIFLQNPPHFTSLKYMKLQNQQKM